MKLPDYLLLGAAFAFLIIGGDQIIKGTYMGSYWVFMLSALCLLIYNFRKFSKKRQNVETSVPQSSKKSKKHTKK